MRPTIVALVSVIFMMGCAAENQDLNQVEPSSVSSASLVFVGVVDKIQNSPLERSEANWIITFRVERVLKGRFGGKTFSTRIHSPAMSGLELGKTYTVKAEKTPTGYTVDQYQWLPSN